MWPISMFFFFFHQKKRNYYLAITKIISQKYCGVKMREPKNQMLGTMVPPYAVKVTLLPEQFRFRFLLKSKYLIVLNPQIQELKKIIRIRLAVTEILTVKVREINNFGSNFLFIFFIFLKIQLPIWRLIMYA